MNFTERLEEIMPHPNERWLQMEAENEVLYYRVNKIMLGKRRPKPNILPVHRVEVKQLQGLSTT